MKSREIEREEWQLYLEAFSRKHDGWLVSISKQRKGTKTGSLARDVPLRGVLVAGASPQTLKVVVLAGREAPEVEHVVPAPASVIVDETDEGAEASLTITDRAGARTVIEFRSPMPSELVDGIPAFAERPHH